MTTRTDPAPFLPAFVPADASTHTFPVPAYAVALGDFVIAGRRAHRVVNLVTLGREGGRRELQFADGSAVVVDSRENVHVVEPDVIPAPCGHAATYLTEVGCSMCDAIVEQPARDTTWLAPKREQDEPEVVDLNAQRERLLELDRELGALATAKLHVHPVHVPALDRLYTRTLHDWSTLAATLEAADADEQAGR